MTNYKADGFLYIVFSSSVDVTRWIGLREIESPRFSKRQFVELENMGEGWIKNAEDDEKMLSVSLFHEFYNRYTPADYWNYTDLPVYPTFETSVSCEHNSL